jgi:phage N-6-adenine-methyltransferase
MNTALMFSSRTDLWATPQSTFDELNAEFGFKLDVCATSENAKCERYITKEQDALSERMWPMWTGALWMNPPYGRQIGKWVERAYTAAREHGATVVCLLPARTDTRWWHDFCMKGEVRFLRGRLKFGEARNPTPFGSAVVIFRGAAKPNEVIQLLCPIFCTSEIVSVAQRTS